MTCYYCASDPDKSWKRMSKAARDPSFQWICEDTDNYKEQSRSISCLSSEHNPLPVQCEIGDGKLLILVRNDTRDFVGFAFELITIPAEIIPQEYTKFYKFVKPITNGVFANIGSVCPIPIPIVINHLPTTTAFQIQILLLRDNSLDRNKISSLIKNPNWSLTGRPDISYTTVGSI